LLKKRLYLIDAFSFYQHITDIFMDVLNTSDEIKKHFYAISEVAEMFNVNASLIRFWESEFPLLTPTKNKKGNRLFTDKDIENFRLIYNLVKVEGYTLQGAKDFLKQKKHKKEAEPLVKIAPKNAAIERLQAIRQELMQMKAKIER
jgi:DNA-binding transcriptional MerR regulator